MKKRTRMARYATVLVAALVAGCSASVSRPEGEGVVFAAPLERTQEAAANALAVHGFDIKKQESGYVEGTRPRKVGLFVGSGGETVGVWMESAGNGHTRVLVKTGKSVVGIAGQRTWDDKILAEMTKELNQEG
jgi:hypothetical protein